MKIAFNMGMIALACLGVLASPAHAFRPTDREMGTLPPYCAARFDSASAAFKSWRVTMGQDFNHVHHYCAGLNFLNRAYGMAAGKDREGTLSGAIRNFDYMLGHARPDFYLRPEILMHRGLALSLANKPGEAMGNLNQAITLNPKLPRAYVALADMFVKQKNTPRALEVITKGLRENPDVRSLQKRYTELGGVLPYPQPETRPAQAEPAPPAVAEETSPAAENPPLASEKPVPEPAAAPPVIVEPKIGSPTNPYCRFCP
jgi:tetratricopeptide (TPR) repeat protein